MPPRLLAVFTLAVVMTVSGCRKDSATPPPEERGPQAAATASVRSVPAELPPVVATVNGVDVKKEELQLAIRNLEGRAGQAVPPDQRDTVYRQVLDRVVGYHVLVQEARARNMTAAPWDVDKRLADIRSQFPSEQAFKDMLQQRGISEDRLRQETAETLAVNAMLEKEFAALPPPADPEVRTFYDGNKPRFREEASVRASHILIRVEQNADAAVRAKAKSQVEGLRAQLLKGAEFSALAKQHSQDPGSAPNGGDLGFFTKGRMVPAFEEAAFATQPGGLSGIVETPFGYHVIKVTETKPARELGFDEVKEQIRVYLQQQTRDQKTGAFVEQLKAKGKVSILL